MIILKKIYHQSSILATMTKFLNVVNKHATKKTNKFKGQSQTTCIQNFEAGHYQMFEK